ncbi:MAG TPA: redoxin domain-containing protein [Candidatus Acidoferrum sp.]|nr:redoxin domain-containing protein [Candidatus Acidoferrum sp.]
MKTTRAILIAAVAMHLSGQANGPGAQNAGPILVQVAELYRDLKTFQIQIRYELRREGEGGGRPIQPFFRTESYRSPDRWRYDIGPTADTVTISRLSDGKTKWVYQPSRSEYTAEPSERVEGGFTSSLQRVSNDSANSVMLGEESVTVEDHRYDCYLIRVTHMGDAARRVPARTDTYWIDKAQLLVLKRVEETTALDRRSTSIEAIAVQRLHLNPRFSDSFFVFVPPAGVHKVAELSPPTEETERLSVGASAPAFHLSDLNGQEQDSLQFKGRFLVLAFWGSWCGPCREEMPVLDLLNRSFGGDGLSVLGVAGHETAEQSRTYLESHHLQVPSWVDGDDTVARKFGVAAWPTTFLIGPEGTVLYVGSGSTVSGLQQALMKAGVWPRP